MHPVADLRLSSFRSRAEVSILLNTGSQPPFSKLDSTLAMGFFSKLKANLTGSWADVSIDAGDAVRGSTATIAVSVLIRDQPIAVDRVQVSIRCVEEISIPNYRASLTAASTSGSSGSTSGTINVNNSETLFSDDVTVDSVVQFAAGEKKRYEVALPLPSDLPPSFEGVHARYVWKVYASLEMTGNDPDSGWREIEVV